MPASRTIAAAYIQLRPEHKFFIRDAQRPMQQAGHSSGMTFGQFFGRAFAAAGALFAASRVKSFLESALFEAEQAHRAAKLTEAVIRSTGGAAKVSLADVDRLTDRLGVLVGVDNDAVRSSANLLLTFTRIRNEVGKGNRIFDQAQEAILDMTAAMNRGVITEENLKNSTIQIGKALNDPIKGITALTRVGVTFTEQQKRQITRLVESGQILKAQKIILAELRTEFGGAGAAAASAAQKAHVAWSNFKESVGELILPAWERVLSLLTTRVVPVLEERVLPAVRRLGEAFDRHVVPRVKAVVAWFRDSLLPRLREFGGWVRDVAIPRLGQWAAAVRDTLMPRLRDLRDYVRDTLIPALVELGDRVRDRLVPALELAGEKLRGFGRWARDDAWPAFARMVQEKVLPALRAFSDWVEAKVVPVVMDLWHRLRVDGGKALADIRKAIEDNRPQLEALVKAFAVVVGAIVVGAGKIAQIMAEKVLPWLGPLLSAQLRTTGVMISGLIYVIGFLVDKFRYLAGVVSWFVGTQITGVKTIIAQWRKFTDFIRGYPGMIRDIFAGAASWLYNAGRNLVTGLWHGILSMAAWFRDKIGGFIINNIPGPVKKILGLGSPSRLFAEFGRDTIRGYVLGVEGERGRLGRAMAGLAGVPAGVAGGGAGGGSRVEALLERLIEAVERVAPGVGRELTGGVSGARRLARAM